MANVSEKVSKRYAKALFELCKMEELDGVKTQLSAFSALWNESKELQKVITNPAYPVSERIAGAQAVAKKVNVSDAKVLNLIALLVQNHRLNAIGSVVEIFSSMIDALRKALSLTVTSAFPIPDAEQQKLKEKLQKEYSGMASVAYTVDKDLIGGLKIQAGYKLLDNSLKSSLEKIRAQLTA